MQQAVMGQATDARTAARRALGPVAVGAIAIAVGLEAIGVYADRSGSDQHRTREFLVVLAIIALAGAVVFGWIVPKMLEREALGTPAIDPLRSRARLGARVLVGPAADSRRGRRPARLGRPRCDAWSRAVPCGDRARRLGARGGRRGPRSRYGDVVGRRSTQARLPRPRRPRVARRGRGRQAS